MWTLAHYSQVTPFSLKASRATSSGGKTLLCPTPFALKMGVLDVAIRVLGVVQAEQLWPLIRDIQIQIYLPEYLTVLHTFSRIVRQRRDGRADDYGTGIDKPFDSTIAYREYVYYSSGFTVALQTGTGDDLPTILTGLLVQLNYLGKRGGFIQFLQLDQEPNLPPDYIALTRTQDSFSLKGIVQMLDDCGTAMTFAQADIYTPKRITIGKERVFRHIVLPYAETRSSFGFSLYERIAR